jgi:hypothetical protein
MTNNERDAVDVVVQEFLEFLDGARPEPTLDHLTAADRRRATDLIESLKAGRGIDPYASRPSLERLLADTPFQDQLGGHAHAATVAHGEVLEKMRNQLAVLGGDRFEVVHDVAGSSPSAVRSDFLILSGPIRLRVQVRHDVHEAADLAELDPSEAAGPVYGRFPDTAGVLLVFPDEDLSSVAVDPFDPEYCIETPSGTSAPPRTHRRVMPLADTLRSYLDEIMPALDLSAPSDSAQLAHLDVSLVASNIAASVLSDVADEGKRARIDAKRETWTTLGAVQSNAVSRVIIDALDGRLDEAALQVAIDAAATEAA